MVYAEKQGILSLEKPDPCSVKCCFLAQHSYVLDYICTNDTQGIQYVLVLGISVTFSGEFCFLYSSAVYHHCTSLSEQSSLPVPSGLPTTNE